MRSRRIQNRTSGTYIHARHEQGSQHADSVESVVVDCQDMAGMAILLLAFGSGRRQFWLHALYVAKKTEGHGDMEGAHFSGIREPLAGSNMPHHTHTFTFQPRVVGGF